MADPLDVLRGPDGPAHPDPVFADRLRARLARALTAPEGVVMSNPTVDLPAATPTPASADEGDGDVGYFSLWVADLDRAVAFYGAVLGWTYAERNPHARTIHGPSPRALVALDAPNAEFWPDPRPGAFVSRTVADIDAAVAKVRAAGGRATDPQETPYGRSADCVDDQGLPFSLHERAPGTPRPATNGADPGDVAYLTMLVPDTAPARRFYGDVFGWAFTPGRINDGWGIEGPAPMSGLSGGHEHAALVPMYRVDDVAAAVDRVRAAGGTATDPEQLPYGISSDCTDDQGLPFYLGQL
ncbi:MAG TPA: VOC family protein [Sporichthya sp.]|nr:VOC family protein [Sporichthya sp.]